MKKTYIQPQIFVVNLISESVLISMSATSGKTTNSVWTNKKEYTSDEPYQHPIWGNMEGEE